MFLKYLWQILTEPGTAWRHIKEQDWTITELYLNVIIPLALISPVAGYVGTTRFGWKIGAGEAIKLTVGSALPISIALFLAILVSVFVIGRLVHWMSDSYGEKKPLARCMALAAYCPAPLFLAGFFQLYPVLWVNFLLGLPPLGYSVYLLYSGVPVLMEIPAERGFVFASAILAMCLVVLVGLLVSTVILWSHGLGPAFVD
ncbi:MAG: Yip1 family protein [Gammaproteobacteria bacterium]|nr:Yip1 family protein [Gammaproteobacteria bacterium]